MSDAMQLLSLKQLVLRIAEEYRADGSIFGINRRDWYRPDAGRTLSVNRESCAMPLGPAAGPHTQLAQNIVSAYLTGSRFFELKTVQILDRLEIAKPCIDAPDEAYNAEWSTELSLEEAWREYARAWIVLNALDVLLAAADAAPGAAPASRGTASSGAGSAPGTRSFIFNMSVGYDLAGIRQEPMQRYIDRMIGREGDDWFAGSLALLDELVPLLADALGVAADAATVERVRAAAAAPICRSVTLSTMHGCPPEEIESICSYLIEAKDLDTFVKLNPTLLGYDAVRSILDDLGFDAVELDRHGFEHDLQYADAVGILTRLRATAAAASRTFGVKLTNTLAVRNTRDVLSGEEMYMSGRALYPISIAVAARIAREFDGALPISFCGGVTIHNAAAILATGIRPLTLCTVLLKPGGYARQAQIAGALDAVERWDRPAIDVAALERLAEGAPTDRTARKAFRGSDAVAVAGTLPATDCYRAPCVEACPIHQHVPEYIRLVGEERYEDALRLISERNALPGITGHICDHQCQHACTRLDYEGCLNIRELKRIAVEKGRGALSAEMTAPAVTRPVPVAVIGAGPAGLSAAYFLARSGFAVTVLEREPNAGGVVRNVIPEFRLPVEAIEEDIAFIQSHGVTFEFGVDTAALSIDALRAEGFGPIVVAIGAERGREIRIDGDQSRILRSLDFLWGFRGNRSNADVRGRVVVVGGGNTAMDAARAAVTLPAVERVDVLYRRGESEMPADREEYENALADGVAFHFLRNPESLSESGELTVREMTLGEPDASGRRRPVASDRTTTMAADTLITAIGETVDSDMLAAFGVPVADGTVTTDRDTLETQRADVYLAGDAASGPSTVVRCIAAGRRVADTIAHRADEAAGTPDATAVGDRRREATLVPMPALDTRLAQVGMRKSRIVEPLDVAAGDRAFARREYERCLECSYVCNRCVEVCPNRANIMVATRDEALFNDPFQIVHLDASCNECGNCGTFCPWTERVPYRDKPTVFSSRAAFDASDNDGWFVGDSTVTYRFGGAVAQTPVGQWPATGDAALVRFGRLFELTRQSRPALFEELS